MNSVTRRAVVLAGIVGLFGISWGVLAVAEGMSPLMACAMSLLVFAGSSQLAALGVVAAGGTAAAGVISGLLLNARYAAFGLAVAPRLGGGLLSRALASQLLIDESAAMAMSLPDESAARRAFWLTGGLVFLGWNAGTLIGALAGTAIADPHVLGLDAAFPAFFLALLAPLLRAPGGAASALAGALIAILLLPMAPPGVPILAAALGALAGPKAIAWRRGR